jgi:hypothetical protein
VTEEQAALKVAEVMELFRVSGLCTDHKAVAEREHNEAAGISTQTQLELIISGGGDKVVVNRLARLACRTHTVCGACGVAACSSSSRCSVENQASRLLIQAERELSARPSRRSPGWFPCRTPSMLSDMVARVCSDGTGLLRSDSLLPPSICVREVVTPVLHTARPGHLSVDLSHP